MAVDPLDELNDALDAVEEALVARHLGVTADVDLSGGENRLGFVKNGSEWMLMVWPANVDGAGRIDLRRCTAAIRLVAARALPHLYDELLRTKTERDRATRGAIDDARMLAVRIREETPSSSAEGGSK